MILFSPILHSLFKVCQGQTNDIFGNQTELIIETDKMISGKKKKKLLYAIYSGSTLLFRKTLQLSEQTQMT